MSSILTRVGVADAAGTRVDTASLSLIVLLGTLASAACGSGSSSPSTPTPPAPPPRAAVTAGCYSPIYQGYGQNQIGCALLTTFGSAAFDQAFAQETVVQNSYYGFSTPVFPFDECPEVKNALSLPQGFILYGRNLATFIVFNTLSGYGVSGTLAHENAHQLQFRNGWMRPTDSTVRTTELEADAFSGLYMGLVKGFGDATLRAYFSTLASFGDYEFNSPSHHGTPTERVAAGLLGLVVADDAITHGTRLSWLQIHNFFIGTIGPSGLKHADLNLSADGQAKVSLVLQGQSPAIPERGPDSSRVRLYPRD
jgi:hypothetical protein